MYEDPNVRIAAHHEKAAGVGLRGAPSPVRGPIETLKDLGENIGLLTARIHQLAGRLCGDAGPGETDAKRLQMPGLLGAVQYGAEESIDMIRRAQHALDRIDSQLT